MIGLLLWSWMIELTLCVLYISIYRWGSCFYTWQEVQWRKMEATTTCYIRIISKLISLKLVLLGSSESKSDCKFGFSMLKNPLVQIFRAIGAYDSIIAIFAWGNMQVFSIQALLNGIQKFWILYSFIVTLFRKNLSAISSLEHLINIL